MAAIMLQNEIINKETSAYIDDIDINEDRVGIMCERAFCKVWPNV